MNKKIEFAKELLDFIYESPTHFHAVIELKKILEKNDFHELKLDNKWNVNLGGKYYIVKNNSALVAFEISKEGLNAGFKIVGAHTDSPNFRIKPSPEIVSDNYIKLNTEPYGGPIINTWLDRPLSIAGRVILKDDNILKPKTEFINIKKPILIIPNLAIHMNREVNKGIELNPQKDTLPIVALINENLEKDNLILKLIAKELDVDINDIVDFELCLYEYEKGCIMGLNDEFISSGRLDDLAMVHAGITAIVRSKPLSGVNVLACFDNEEVGSQSKQGAGSKLLYTVLERIAIALGKDREDFLVALEKSFLISSDMAHAVHPNVPEKSDPTSKVKINCGTVVKVNASQRYTTDADSSAVYQELSKRAGVPVQMFVNRSDERGGSTIGPISSTHLDIRSVDIGNPILAMHSIRELSGVDDHMYLEKTFEEFYKI